MSNPDPDLDTSTLDADEAAGGMPDDPVAWDTDITRVSCPEGSTNDDGRCTPAGDLAPASAGCAAAVPPGALLVLLVLGFALRRRKKAVLALALAAACATDAGGWDDAVDQDAPAGEARLDVYSADLGDGDGAQLLLAHQALVPAAQQPAEAFALASARGDVPILRAQTACGDRLGTTEGDELLGWAAAEPGDGTAELVELAAPDGCAHVYETAPDTIAALVADGYEITNRLGHVWPPALATDDLPVEALPLAPACAPTTSGPWFLLYASPGADESETFLAGCHGEVIVGEKRDAGPVGRMRLAANHAKGGRTAFVLDRNGDMLREMLARPNGVARTAADLKAKLAAGYDYLVIDEITSAPDWADGASLNVKLRKLLLKLPPRTVIGYVSIDLTQYADGAAKMKNRRLLLRALRQRGRGLAMEVYLHTPQVMAGRAPATYRIAADRLARAVAGLAHGGGINQRAISVVGTSMHSAYAQYRYLDQGSHDLASITKQVNAIRHASKRTRQQQGVGYYFVNKSDMAPPSAYSYDALIARMRAQLGRF